MRRTVSLIISIFIIVLAMPVVVAGVTEITKFMGIRASAVPVVGTGSMYPSLFWDQSEGGPDDAAKMSVEEYRTTPHMYRRFPGITLGGRLFFRKNIGYGDMVAFRNQATIAILEKENKNTDSGFIKRVVGLPGDTLELRDGYVMRNGVRIDEPYIYKPRSTYGETFLPDCRPITLGEGQYFVLGDNRKTSSDSRGDLGPVKDADISFVLPFSEQKIYHSLWRDTSRDGELSGLPTLSAQEFYDLLNAERTKRRLPVVKVNSGLVRSSAVKGKSYLSGREQTLAESLASAGAGNILNSEFVTPGHFTAEELLQNLLYFPETSAQILEPQYQEIGVSAVNRDIDSCPTQVIVGHLGGYIPPDYNAELIESWTALAGNLETIIPSWEKAREYPNIDQGKLSELLTILNRRLSLARDISAVMRDNKWLTPGEERRVDADEADGKRANQLIEELNRE